MESKVTRQRTLSMYGKVLLLYNGNAGQKEVEDVLEVITGILVSHTDEFILKRTEYKGHAEEICRDRGEEMDLVCILGGDGTVHECVNGLADLETPPLTAILPGGTCNDFSRSLGIPQNIKKAAEVIIEGSTAKVDLLKANRRWVSNFVGMGLITTASENIDAQLKGTFGRLSYYLSAFKTIREAKPFRYSLKLPDKSITDQAVMILAANGNYIGTSQLPALHDKLDDGKMNFFVLREAGLSLLRNFLQSKDLNEWDRENPAFDFAEAEEVEISTEEPMKLDMDGEVYEQTPVKITIHRERMTFIKGEIN
ncbi:diacylglycerol/lipid kinase family protein [Alteribacter natronophilus]|uniref:diacylglycerol/lipid kinase family protein n=1 Tax=Alteribacter natronophilus TaxID=2583810 RepID=UPI0014862045|nr:diacylglycerol kinase family protein [Alteribacter natronophilus]